MLCLNRGDMKLVEIATSRRAVEQIAQRINGRRLIVRDINAYQSIEPDPVRQSIPSFGKDAPIMVRRKFRPECRACLTETGYVHPLNLDGYTLEDRNGEFKPPNRLEQCKAALGNSVSRFEVETDDGAKFSFALVEGCRGGLGRAIREEGKLL